jgi:hypothetical protein
LGQLATISMADPSSLRAGSSSAVGGLARARPPRRPRVDPLGVTCYLAVWSCLMGGTRGAFARRYCHVDLTRYREARMHAHRHRSQPEWIRRSCHRIAERRTPTDGRPTAGDDRPARHRTARRKAPVVSSIAARKRSRATRALPTPASMVMASEEATRAAYPHRPPTPNPGRHARWPSSPRASPLRPSDLI